jgi:hypothetical protein
MLEHRRLNGLLVFANACLPSADVNLDADCLHTANRDIDVVEHMSRARTVIVAFDWKVSARRLVRPDGSVPRDRDAALVAGIDNTVGRLLSAGKHVILVGPLFAPGWDLASVLSREIAFGRQPSHLPYVSRSRFDKEFDRGIEHVSSKNGIIFVRPFDVHCDDDRCSFLHNGVPLFSDSSHLARSQLRLFRPMFEAAFETAGLPSQ